MGRRFNKNLFNFFLNKDIGVSLIIKKFWILKISGNYINLSWDLLKINLLLLDFKIAPSSLNCLKVIIKTPLIFKGTWTVHDYIIKKDVYTLNYFLFFLIFVEYHSNHLIHVRTSRWKILINFTWESTLKQCKNFKNQSPETSQNTIAKSYHFKLQTQLSTLWTPQHEVQRLHFFNFLFYLSRQIPFTNSWSLSHHIMRLKNISSNSIIILVYS